MNHLNAFGHAMCGCLCDSGLIVDDHNEAECIDCLREYIDTLLETEKDAEYTTTYHLDPADFHKKVCLKCMSIRPFDFDTQTYGKCRCKEDSDE
ncbi:MAG: hypothetical protein KAS32_27070 [Candidatus Peribacteraceae bacterium]|nr:hypothetical protein [Candidatus Peribacteraceae bacterium]